MSDKRAAAKRKQRAAVHEAGHAVAALLVAGGRFAPRLVTVEAEGRRHDDLATPSGFTSCRQAERRTKADLDAWAVVVAAGAIAQGTWSDASRDEDALVAAFNERFDYERKLAAWCGRIETRARRLLARPRARRAVRRLAQEIVTQGTIRGERAIARAAGRRGERRLSRWA